MNLSAYVFLGEAIVKGLRSILVGGTLAMMAGAFAQGVVPNQLVVKFKPGSQAMEPRIHSMAGTKVVRTIPSLGYVLVEYPSNRTRNQVASVYMAYPSYVTRVSENPTVRFFDTIPNDARWGEQWGPAKVQAPKMWDRNVGETSTIVAVVDSGVKADHPDLVGNLIPGYDVGNDDPDPNDVVGHGTHCIGIAGGVGNNGIGISGMGWKHKVMPVRIDSDTTGAFNAAAGIIYAADHGANVISMSFGVGQSPVMDDAIEYAWGKNILLIAAAGNDSSQNQNYPASHPHVLAVASSAPDDSRSPFSTFGQWVEVAAPGQGILSTVVDADNVDGTGYGKKDGTSMACPLVAGLAGVLYAEAGVTANNQAIWDIICASSEKVDYVKFGRVNAAKAIDMIEVYTTVTKNATAASMFVGLKMTGGVAQLSQKDNKVAFITSSLQTSTGATAGAIIDFTVTDPISSLIDPQIHLATRTEVPATLMTFLYNNSTKKWDFVNSSGTKNTTLDHVMPLPSAMGNYITAQGKIRVLVRSHVPVTRGRVVSSYRLQLDQAVFESKVRIIN